MKLTLQQRYQRYYEAHGYVHVQSRTRKYITLKGQNRFVFLGKAGAVRCSTTMSISGSLSLDMKSRLEAWEKDQGL